MSKTPRETALMVLEQCRRKQAFSDSLLASVLAASGLGAKDRALVSRLCYGVLQNTILLDFYTGVFCGGVKKLEPTVRDILRLSIYQILFLDRIPDHAAVSEAVELCKKSGRSRAAGLVNAVLRRAAGSRDKLPEIPRGSIENYLSIKYSTPAALTAEFIKEFGADFTEKLLEANNGDAPLTIQVNTLKTTTGELTRQLEREGVSCSPHEYLPNALNISPSGNLSELESFRKGLFYVQDAAAWLSVLAAAPEPGQRVLDACAAPGGKSFSCALLMENSGSITACDIHENRLDRVRNGAKALGIEIITAVQNDAAKPNSGFAGAFDIVIADVPCSGLGVIRKKPDIRYKSLDDIRALPELQLKILDNLAGCVKTGGALLYSTCTILRRENEDVVNAFLSGHPEFSTEGFTLPGSAGEAKSGRITLFPHVHGTDGFFICKLRKTNEN